MMGIRQALADPLQPPECVLGDIDLAVNRG